MNVTLKAGTVLADGSTLAADLTLELPRWKGLVMGRPGGGKSHFVASFPKPLLVLATDPEEKLAPYLDRCGAYERTVGQFGQPIIVGMSPKTGNPIMQIECFYDLEPTSPVAFTNLLARGEQIRSEAQAGIWATVALDSWTQLETFALWRRQSGPMAVKDADAFGRAHGAAYDDLKPFVMTRLVPLGCNLCIVFHTSDGLKDEGGVQFFGIKAGGKALPTQIPSLLTERYRATAEADGVTRRLWTRPDGRYDLCTTHNVPSPCDNDFTKLWANWIAKRAVAANAAAAQPAAADAAPQEGVAK